MSTFGGLNIVKDGLVFGYDSDDRSSRFYKGEPSTNIYVGPLLNGMYFKNAFNGTNYGFGDNTNIQSIIDNSNQPISNLNVQRISRINSNISQPDYIEWTELISRGGGIIFQPNEVRNISFYYKGTYGTQLNPYIGNSGTLLLYSDNAVAGNGTTSIVIPVITNEWQRISFRIVNNSSTNTSTIGYAWMILHKNITTTILNNTEQWKFTGIQVEQKSHVTQFISSSRSNTNSLIDLKTTTTIDLTNISFDSTAHPILVATDSNCIYAELNYTNPTSITIECIFSPTLFGGWQCVMHRSDTSTIDSSEYWIGLNITNNYITGTIGAKTGVPGTFDAGITNVIPVIGNYYHVVSTWNGSNVNTYINGVLKKTYTLSTYSLATDPTIRFGAASDNGGIYAFNGKIPISKVYLNKAFTSQEVVQNYNAYKNRFNL